MSSKTSVALSDLSHSKLEDLIALFQQQETRAVWSEVNSRVQSWRDRFITRLAQDWFDADVDDLKQKAALDMLEAMRAYHSAEKAKPKGDRFRQFLARIIRSRFLDHVRGLRRAERHVDRSAEARAVVDNDLAEAAGMDPARAAEAKELWERWFQLAGRLKAAERRLVELKRSDLSNAAIAQALHLTEGQVRYRWGLLRKKLRDGLAEWIE